MKSRLHYILTPLILFAIAAIFAVLYHATEPAQAQTTAATFSPSPTAGHVVQRVSANVAASQTDASLVAAVSGRTIRVLGVVTVTGATATNVTFNSKGSGAGTAISCLFANGANGGFALPPTTAECCWFATNAGEALTVTTGTGATTGFQVIYVQD